MKNGIMKGRELQRRGSGTIDLHKKDLNDDFDKELMTDEEVRAGREEGADPPEQHADGFWENMSWMWDAKLDIKVGVLEKNLSVALAHLECSLGTSITAEEERRLKELLATNQRIDGVLLRMEALELASAGPKLNDLADRLTAVENMSATAAHDKVGNDFGAKQTAGDSWVADHLVVGGWRPDASNEEKVAAMAAVLCNMPADTKGRHLRPFAQRKDMCSMLKVRFESAALAARASFAISQRLQAVPPPDKLQEPNKKWWAATERHPTVALRRIIVWARARRKRCGSRSRRPGHWPGAVHDKRNGEHAEPSMPAEKLQEG